MCFIFFFILLKTLEIFFERKFCFLPLPTTQSVSNRYKTDLHEEKAHNESWSLAVSNLSIMDAVGLHNIEQRLLANTIFLLEEVVLRIGASNISSDNLG